MYCKQSKTGGVEGLGTRLCIPLGCPPQQVAASVHVANRSANFAIQSPRSAVSACCGGGRGGGRKGEGEEGHVVKRVGSFHTPIKSTKPQVVRKVLRTRLCYAYLVQFTCRMKICVCIVGSCFVEPSNLFPFGCNHTSTFMIEPLHFHDV